MTYQSIHSPFLLPNVICPHRLNCPFHHISNAGMVENLLFRDDQQQTFWFSCVLDPQAHDQTSLCERSSLPCSSFYNQFQIPLQESSFQPLPLPQRVLVGLISLPYCALLLQWFLC